MENKQMNIYARLLKVRNDIQRSGMKKLGENKFSGYSYFTLDTIVPVVNDLCDKYGVAPIISFSQGVATLTAYNVDNPEEFIVFETPFVITEMKGQNRIQAVMSAHTYFRRALYLIFADICEPDEVDYRSEEDRKEVEQVKQEDDKKEKLIKEIIKNKENKQLQTALKNELKETNAKSIKELPLESLVKIYKEVIK